MHIRAWGLGHEGCLGFAEGVLMAHIISLTVSLKTLPQFVFLDIISTPEIIIMIIIYASIIR